MVNFLGFPLLGILIFVLKVIHLLFNPSHCINDELQIVRKQLYNPSQTEQTADICPPQQLTHLKPPDLQTDKTSAFSIFTVADAQIIKYM